MHLKFLKIGIAHRKRSAHKAAAYFTRETDHKGKTREQVKVLRGDPSQVALVADSLPFKYKFISGLIAWSPSDAPSDSDIQDVLDDFEKVAWAGLSADRYCWSAILHRDSNGGVHIHIFAARVDLVTGKSLNIAPPGWQKAFDPLRDYWNYKMGWDRPDDIERTRPYQPTHHALINAATLRQGIKVEPDTGEFITEYLLEQLDLGLVYDRNTLIQSLKEAGIEVTRQGKNFISIRPEPDAKPLRLKGAIYESNFTVKQLERTTKTKNTIRPSGDRTINEERAQAAQNELQKAITRRTQYNSKRYKLLNESNTAKKQPVTQAIFAENMDTPPADCNESLDRYLRRQLGINAISIHAGKRSTDQNRSDEPNDSEFAESWRQNSTESLRQQTMCKNQSQHRNIRQKRRIQNIGGLLDDRTRNTINQRIESIIQRVQHSCTSLGRRVKQFTENVRNYIDRKQSTSKASVVLGKASRQFEQSTKSTLSSIRQRIKKDDSNPNNQFHF
ncbi:MAG: relaxase/mobilization nuclease domain-containing protein [Proteobacteria bacterium]|nr:hypothetical protein [Pseudomonadota bacterium]NOG58867.1 relaxase/mobilization nuclease domain-containing protein [Pseudomonadota bacterium]